jgi:ankyrin repeat protein
LGDLDNLKIQFDKQPKDEGLLHLAIKSGHLKIVDFLLSRNLSPNHVSNGQPAICLAARLNLCEIVKLLLKHGANVAVLDAEKQSPLAFVI